MKFVYQRISVSAGVRHEAARWRVSDQYHHGGFGGERVHDSSGIGCSPQSELPAAAVLRCPPTIHWFGSPDHRRVDMGEPKGSTRASVRKRVRRCLHVRELLPETLIATVSAGFARPICRCPRLFPCHGRQMVPDRVDKLLSEVFVVFTCTVGSAPSIGIHRRTGGRALLRLPWFVRCLTTNSSAHQNGGRHRALNDHHEGPAPTGRRFWQGVRRSGVEGWHPDRWLPHGYRLPLTLNVVSNGRCGGRWTGWGSRTSSHHRDRPGKVDWRRSFRSYQLLQSTS